MNPHNLRTKEDTKRAVLSHLSRVARNARDDDPRPFSLHGIQASLPDFEPNAVESALESLAIDDSIIDKREVTVTVHLPKNADGRRALQAFARSRSISFSKLGGVALVIIAIAAASVKFNFMGPTEEDLMNAKTMAAESAMTAGFWDGFTSATVTALIFGFPGGLLVSHYLTRFLRWTLLSPETFATLRRATKWGTWSLVISLGSYYVTMEAMGRTIEFAIASAIAGFVLPVTLAALSLVRRREEQAQGPHAEGDPPAQ